VASWSHHDAAHYCGRRRPADAELVRYPDAAPTAASAAYERSSGGDSDELYDGHGSGSAELEAANEPQPEPQVHDIFSSAMYRRLYGTLSLYKAVLGVHCRMELFGGCRMGENMADTTRSSGHHMHALADEAQEFVVECVDLLFGPAHTTKAHRLANHLLAALSRNGNLWEGGTSENEAPHGPSEMMDVRTNNRKPFVVLKTMRASDTQAEVLRELKVLENDDEGGGDGLLRLLEGNDDGGDVGMTSSASLSRSHRGPACASLARSECQKWRGEVGRWKKMRSAQWSCRLLFRSTERLSGGCHQLFRLRARHTLTRRSRVMTTSGTLTTAAGGSLVGCGLLFAS